MNYYTNRAWSDRYTPLIKRELVEWLRADGFTGFEIVESTEYQDWHENTDLIVQSKDMKWSARIACRVRRPGYVREYGDQITINDGHEYERLMAGYGDFMFYGFANRDDNGFARYYIVKLSAVRALFKANRCSDYVNFSRDSKFYVIRISSLNDDDVLKSEIKELTFREQAERRELKRKQLREQIAFELEASLKARGWSKEIHKEKLMFLKIVLMPDRGRRAGLWDGSF